MNFRADLREVDELIVKLRRAAEIGELEVFAAVLQVGAEVKEAASVIAGEHSKSIPSTIKLRPVPPRSVEIQSGSPDVPIAALYELGNKGGGRTSKTFRHPVFGQDVWVEQPRYRYLATARAHLAKKIRKQMVDSWTTAMRKSGIEVETR